MRHDFDDPQITPRESVPTVAPSSGEDPGASRAANSLADPLPPPQPAPVPVLDLHGEPTDVQSAASTQRALPLPPDIPGYEILTELGQGGMGVVYKARQVKLNRLVALKMILPDGLAGAEELARFHAEAEAVARLQHPHIVQIYEVGEHGGRPFFSLELVDGGSLDQRLAETSLPLREAALLMETLAQAVHHAHQCGIVHRDLKPANILLTADGTPKVTDFGLAKFLDRGSGARGYQTQSGAILGSPSYMAPEQAGGKSKDIGPPSDVYALGTILYEALTGRPPFRGATLLDTLEQVRSQEPVSPRSLLPKLPRDLETICLKCLRKEPHRRYTSALELADDLRRWLNGESIRARPTSIHVRLALWAKRRPAVAALLGGIVLVTGLGFAGVTWQWRQTLAALAETEQARREEAAAWDKEAEARVKAELERLAKEEERKKAQAHQEVKDFRHLVDEMQFYAPGTNPVAERAPYYDPQRGEAAGRAALAIADKWGEGFADLPVPKEEREALRQELYAVLLLLVQAKSQQPRVSGTAPEMLTLLDRASALQPFCPAYHRLRSHCYRLLGEDGRAAEEQRRADALPTPRTALDCFLRGEDYRTEAARQAEVQTTQTIWHPSRDLLLKAIEQFRQALQITPNHYWSHLQLGRCYLSLGRGPEALEALSAYVALRRDSPWGYSARGLALVLMKQYAEGQRDLDRAVQLSPDFRPALLNRGVAFWLQKRYDAALVDFAAVLEPPDEKKLIEAAYYRGQVHLERGDLGAALEDFDRVLAERPSFRPAYLRRAEVYLLRGEDGRALEDLNTFLADGRPFDPTGGQAHEQRGRLLRRLVTTLELAPAERHKKLHLALTQLLRAEELGRRSAALFDDFGAVWEYVGQGKRAVEAYSQGLEQEPQNTGLLIKRGWAYATQENYAKAQDDFARAARVEPRNAEAYTGLGYVLACQNTSAEAQRQAAHALLHGGGDYLILHNVACIYARLSEADNGRTVVYQNTAVGLLQRAVELWKWGGAGPSEVELIKAEAAFPKSMREREDFQKLVNGAAP